MSNSQAGVGKRRCIPGMQGRGKSGMPSTFPLLGKRVEVIRYMKQYGKIRIGNIQSSLLKPPWVEDAPIILPLVHGYAVELRSLRNIAAVKPRIFDNDGRVKVYMEAAKLLCESSFPESF
jgi:hypothetical protein